MRVCTELYEPPSPANIDNACMHLTNYAVNKTSAKFRGAYSGGYDPEEDAAHASVRMDNGSMVQTIIPTCRSAFFGD